MSHKPGDAGTRLHTKVRQSDHGSGGAIERLLPAAATSTLELEARAPLGHRSRLRALSRRRWRKREAEQLDARVRANLGLEEG